MNCGKDIAIAALVRAFFKYYVTGVLETQTDSETSELFEPKNIKRMMLDRYERISKTVRHTGHNRYGTRALRLPHR